MSDDAVVEILALNHWFGTGDARKQALFDIDLTLARGSLTLSEEPEIEPLKEADLVRHLEDVEPVEMPPAPAAGTDDAEAPLAAEDYQLSEALNVLKGLSIFGGKLGAAASD